MDMDMDMDTDMDMDMGMDIELGNFAKYLMCPREGELGMLLSSLLSVHVRICGWVGENGMVGARQGAELGKLVLTMGPVWVEAIIRHVS